MRAKSGTDTVLLVVVEYSIRHDGSTYSSKYRASTTTVKAPMNGGRHVPDMGHGYGYGYGYAPFPARREAERQRSTVITASQY